MAGWEGLSSFFGPSLGAAGGALALGAVGALMGNKSRSNQRTSQGGTQSQQQTQQTKVQAESPEAMQMRQAAQQAALMRHFLMQRQAQSVFNENPYQTPEGMQAQEAMNRQFSEQQDMRSFQGNASPIENARALGMSDLFARLHAQNFQKQLALGNAMGPSPGELGMQGLGQQIRLAGSPMVSNMSGSGNQMGNTRGSNSNWGMSDFGNMLTGIGNIYSGYMGMQGMQKQKAGQVTQSPSDPWGSPWQQFS